MTAQSWIAKPLQAYWRWSRGLTFGAQGCVLRDDGHVLLVRHTYRPGWHFPGGGVEKSETVGTALAREIDEEAGIVLTGAPQLFAIYANHARFPGDHIALFVVHQWDQPAPPPPGREIAEHGFFPTDALPAGTQGPTARRIAEVLGTRQIDEMW